MALGGLTWRLCHVTLTVHVSIDFNQVSRLTQTPVHTPHTCLAMCVAELLNSSRLVETAGFRRDEDANCALLEYNVACSDVSGLPIGNSDLPTPSTTIGCPDTSVRNNYSLWNTSEECSSQHGACTCLPRVLFNL